MSPRNGRRRRAGGGWVRGGGVVAGGGGGAEATVPGPAKCLQEMEGGDELARGAEPFHPALWRPDRGSLEPAGTIADRPCAPNPGAPVRPAIVNQASLPAAGWLKLTAENRCLHKIGN